MTDDRHHTDTQAGIERPVPERETALERRVRTLEQEFEHATDAVDDAGYAIQVLADVDGRLRADLARGLTEIGRWLTWLGLRIAHEDPPAEPDRPAPSPRTGEDGP